MEYSGKVEREISENGIEFDLGSVYARLSKLTDVRKAKGKRYSLTTIMMIILMAKLCGENTALGIADWAKNRQAELVKILGLDRPSMPNHNTYRRMLAYIVYEEEIGRLVGEYNQQGEQGEIYALDGKAIRGMRKKDDPIPEYALSVYDVKQGKVMAQVEVGRKENEISKAPEALKLVEISKKMFTGDAMHTQKRFSKQILEGQGDFVFPVKENQEKLCKNIQAMFASEYPKPGFGKIQTDFLTAQKVNKGHTCTCGVSAGVVALKPELSKPVKCLIHILAGLAWHKSIAWNVKSNGGAVESVIEHLVKSNLELQVYPAKK